MALNFDVTNDYVSVPDSATVNFGTGSFAIAFWFNSHAGSTQDMINKNRATATATTLGYGFTISSAAATGFSFHMGNGTTYNRIDTGAQAARGGNVWTHCIINVDRTNQLCNIWFNGGLIVTNAALTLTGTITTTAQLNIGACSPSPSRYFDGWLSEIILMPRLFTAEERIKLYGAGTPLKYYPQTIGANAYWPMDEFGNGQVSWGVGSVKDHSGNNNHGTPQGAQTGYTEQLTYRSQLFTSQVLNGSFY